MASAFLNEPNYDFRRSCSQRDTYMTCPYKWLLHYLQGWRPKYDKGQWVFGRIFENLATCIAAGLVTDSAEAVRLFQGAWYWLDPTTIEWSTRVTFEALGEQGTALAKVIVPEIRERILVPEPGQMFTQEDIRFFLAPQVEELSIPDLYCHVRQDLFSDYLPTVLDFKTGDRDIPPLSVELDPQLTGYQLAQEAHGRVVAQLGLCRMIRGSNPRIQWLLVPRRPEHVTDQFLASAIAIDKAIKQGQFWQNPRACFRMGTCEMVPLCYAAASTERDQRLTRVDPKLIDLFTGWDD